LAREVVECCAREEEELKCISGDNGIDCYYQLEDADGGVRKATKWSEGEDGLGECKYDKVDGDSFGLAAAAISKSMETKIDITLEGEIHDCLYDDGGEEEGDRKRLGDELR
jgi:hypothetical protein